MKSIIFAFFLGVMGATFAVENQGTCRLKTAIKYTIETIGPDLTLSKSEGLTSILEKSGWSISKDSNATMIMTPLESDTLSDSSGGYFTFHYTLSKKPIDPELVQEYSFSEHSTLNGHQVYQIKLEKSELAKMSLAFLKENGNVDEIDQEKPFEQLVEFSKRACGLRAEEEGFFYLVKIGLCMNQFFQISLFEEGVKDALKRLGSCRG
jgi:hypothetical protein